MMNERFVNIKVDREERPDLDNLYMAAVQAMTGQGGWPMSVFLTPDLRAVLRRHLLPPDRLPGDARFPPRPPERRASLEGASRMRSSPRPAGDDRADSAVLGVRSPRPRGAVGVRLARRRRASSGPDAYEPVHGGFGSAPKFPHPMDVRVLLRHHARVGDAHAAPHGDGNTLDKMARGGIYDHLGRRVRPLLDRRPLAGPALREDALRQRLAGDRLPRSLPGPLRDLEYARVARETMDYVLESDDRPRGPASTPPRTPTARASRGNIYVWTLAEITEILRPDRAKEFASLYDVTDHGNWEHSPRSSTSSRPYRLSPPGSSAATRPS